MSTTTATLDVTVPAGIVSPSNIFYFLLVPAVLLYYAYWRISRRHMLELASKIPGPEGFPFIGNALEFAGSSHDIYNQIYDTSFEFGHVVKFWIGRKLTVFLSNPKDVELILGSQAHLEKSKDYRFFKPWLGDGLLISNGQKWKAHRKLIAPAFNLNVPKSFIDLFNANSRDVVQKLSKEGNNEFDIHHYMSEATVEILLETAMGVNKKIQEKSGYAIAVMKMCDILHLRHTKFWLYPDTIFNLTKFKTYQNSLVNTIHTLSRKVIKAKKANFFKGIYGSTAEVPEYLKTHSTEDKVAGKTVVDDVSFGQSELKNNLDVDDDIREKKRMAFLELLIEASQSGVVINDAEIQEEVDTIMFEGHDTTSVASSFFLCMMGNYPEYQARVVQELYDIFGDSDRPATFADTLEMKYLERCLLETLRLYPPVPVNARHLNEDVKLASCDLTLPANTTVVIATYKIHRWEETYPNPNTFDPDNFLPERTAKRHYYSFIPFSAGPRICVGRKYAMLKLKVLLSTIMRNYSITSTVKQDDFKLQGDIILKRADGFKVRLEPRKSMAIV